MRKIGTIFALCFLLFLSACGKEAEEPVRSQPVIEEIPEQSDQIVLSCESADLTIDEAQFQYYFGHQFAKVLEAYGENAFDPGQDLSAQAYDDTQSWQDVLLTQAFDHAEQTAQLCLAAKEAGFTDPAAQRLDEVEKLVEQSAKEKYFPSAEAYLAANYGEGATVSGYSEFLQNVALADAYSQSLLTDREYPAEEVEAFYDSHAEDYADTFQISKDDKCRLDVRMIRFYPDDPSDPKDWSETEARANVVIKELEGSPTDETAAILADRYTEDFNAPDGGLYKKLSPGMNSASLDEWLFPEGQTRVPGDWKLLREDDVYTLCYVSAAEDIPYWRVVAEQDMRYADYINELSTLSETYIFTRYPENVTLRVPTAHIAENDIPDNVAAVG